MPGSIAAISAAFLDLLFGRTHARRAGAWQTRPRDGEPVSGALGLAGASNPDFYRSIAWRVVRYQALKRSKGCCECCGNRATALKPLHVDHVKPRSKYPELALALSNLQVLCEDCNLGKLAWDETDWRH